MGEEVANGELARDVGIGELEARQDLRYRDRPS